MRTLPAYQRDGLVTGLTPSKGMGVLIFERVSHLDAFSGYPFRRWLICHALGRTTDTPELRPSRSSRTRDSIRQHSTGCGG